MIRKCSVAVLGLGLAAVMTACGSGNDTIKVGMNTDSCSFPVDTLQSGPATFKVTNDADEELVFRITENEKGSDEVELVDSVTVRAGGTREVEVDLHDDDVYQFSCGSVPGPSIQPEG